MAEVGVAGLAPDPVREHGDPGVDLGNPRGAGVDGERRVPIRKVGDHTDLLS